MIFEEPSGLGGVRGGPSIVTPRAGIGAGSDIVNILKVPEQAALALEGLVALRAGYFRHSVASQRNELGRTNVRVVLPIYYRIYGPAECQCQLWAGDCIDRRCLLSALLHVYNGARAHAGAPTN